MRGSGQSLFSLPCVRPFSLMVRRGRGRGRAGGRPHEQPAQHPQHATRLESWFTTAVMLRWRTAAVAPFPHTHHRRQWPREV